MLAELGHANVWSYPYSVFRAACEVVRERAKTQAKAQKKGGA